MLHVGTILPIGSSLMAYWIKERLLYGPLFSRDRFSFLSTRSQGTPSDNKTTSSTWKMYLWILLQSYATWLLRWRQKYCSVHLLYSDSYWVFCLTVSKKMTGRNFLLSIGIPWQSSFLSFPLFLPLPCLHPTVVFRSKTAGSIAMLSVLCRPSFKCLMPRWQTRPPATHPGGPLQAGAGGMPHLSEADYRCTQTLIKSSKGEEINLPWQEGCVSLYTPNRN